MSREFAKIRTISRIEPIDGADRVELAFVDGWRCVVLRDQFSSGEEILFIEADAALKNIDDERTSFLKKSSLKQWRDSTGVVLAECLRVKTVKLAGVFSQGLVLKKELFEREISESVEQGKSLDEVLNIVHYDELSEEMTEILDPEKAMFTRGSFPSFISKTDAERIQNLPGYFEELKDMEFEVSVKVDGSSMTAGWSPSRYPDEPFFVCSRKNMFKTDYDNVFCRTAKKLRLAEILSKFYDETKIELCIQGELAGPGIEQNRGRLQEIDYLVFQIFDLTNCRWLTPEERLSFCREVGLSHVDVLSTSCKIFQECPTIESLISKTDMKSKNGSQIEGLVFKSRDGLTVFKAINPGYLIKNQ